MSDLRGLVTAAGLSTRIGGFPKPRLHADGSRFVETILDSLAAAGGRGRTVVLGYEHEVVLARTVLDDAEVVVKRHRDAFREGDDDVVQPPVDGESGHPALFGASTVDALQSTPEDERARAVVYDNATDVERIAVDDEAILADIDTPEEYWAAVTRHG